MDVLIALALLLAKLYDRSKFKNSVKALYFSNEHIFTVVLLFLLEKNARVVCIAKDSHFFSSPEPKAHKVSL